MTKIAIIDYDIGNVKSIISALENVGAEVVLTRDTELINSADGVVLPGVGAFSHGMMNLEEYGLDKILQTYADSGKPLLGICLGMQMLFSESEEFGITKGLGIIDGKIVRLKTLNPQYEKLPHVSWNELLQTKNTPWKDTILDGLDNNSNMYFVHTFAANPTDHANILSSTIYSDSTFCSSVKRGNVYGCQFHPEKSATLGLLIMKNFVTICKEHNYD